MRVMNALSVDVEEYYHATIFQEAMAGHELSRLESRVERSTDRVLDLLASHDVRATFFILGEVAAAHPGLVRRIAAAGHELACHGYDHSLVSDQSPERFRDGIRSAKTLVEDLAGCSVLGYRAPSFSIGRHEAWAYEVLAEEGFQYDSSLYPIVHDRYGDRTAPRFPHEVWRRGSLRLLEFPIATARLLGVNVPIGGGGFFRLLPAGFFTWGIGRLNRTERRPALFYFHPWELDPGQPRPPMAWHRRFRHYVGQARHAEKLARLLRTTSFHPIRDVLGLTEPPAPWRYVVMAGAATGGPITPRATRVRDGGERERLAAARAEGVDRESRA
jgi:polysaccharide deacetylase family protein (PEP-CTERM system associated)